MKATRDPAVMVVLAIFALLGLGFWIAAGWIGLGQHRIITTWPRTMATVLSSRVSLLRPDIYSAEVSLSYRVGTTPFTHTFQPASETSVHSLMQQLVDRYPSGSKHELPYNPANPQEVVLDAGYSFDFFMLPVIFAGVGLVLMLMALSPWIWALFATIFASRRQPGHDLSDRVPQLVGGSFVVLGGLFLGLVIWFGVAQARAAGWPAVEAEIVSSRVMTYTRKSRTSVYYAPEVEFRYAVKGRTYLTPASPEKSLSQEAAAEKIATIYSPGQRQTLHYNPANPYQLYFGAADFTWGWILAGIGGVFLLLGTVVMAVFRPSAG